MPARNPYSNLAGPRLPSKVKDVPACLRCAEERRKLIRFRLVHVLTERPIGVIVLCEPCVREIAPPPSADPLMAA